MSGKPVELLGETATRPREFLGYARGVHADFQGHRPADHRPATRRLARRRRRSTASVCRYGQRGRDARPGFQQALASVRSGDCLVVWKLDRLGRSLSHLLHILTTLQAQGVAFRSLTEQMDTTTPQGACLLRVFGALAQYERALTQERIRAGLEAARRRGTRGGRPKAISAEKLEAILAALHAGASKASLSRAFGVKRTTLYDTLARAAA